FLLAQAQFGVSHRVFRGRMPALRCWYGRHRDSSCSCFARLARLLTDEAVPISERPACDRLRPSIAEIIAVAEPDPPLTQGRSDAESTEPPSVRWLIRNRAKLLLAVRMTVATLAAFGIATYFALPQAYWAVLTALIVTQSSVGGSLKAALDRLIGSLCGAVW